MFKRLACLVALALAAGCGDENPMAPPAPEPAPAPEALGPSLTIAQGLTAFQNACTPCHTTNDGFDLALFSYPDTAILRRAVKHVSPIVAADIIAFVKTVHTAKLPENAPIAQPGGQVIAAGPGTAGDIAFAKNLFGADQWPATLTRTSLLAINPLNVKIALKLLPWSDETSSLEWLPTDPLPPAILSFKGNAASKAIAAYRTTPTLANVHAVMTAVDAASRDMANSIKPCRLQNTTVNYRQCFEIRRWLASFTLMHAKRNGLNGFVSTPVHLLWWDVGDIARRAYGKKAIPDQKDQHARWMYLGWMFDPTFEPAIYTTDGMLKVGLPRHAAFVALRSQVARTPTSFTEDESPYVDFKVLTDVVPPGTAWAYNASLFSLNELLRRLNAGQRPPGKVERATAKAQVDQGIAQLKKKVTAGQLTTLTKLAKTIKTKVGT